MSAWVAIPTCTAPTAGANLTINKSHVGNFTLGQSNAQYTITVSNTGNQTLSQVTVNDPLTGLSITGVTLAPGASQTYLTSYSVTQDDLDGYGGGDGFIENTATADSLQTNAVSDTEEIELFVRAALSIDKTLISITNGNLNSVADAAGDRLNYSVTVSNLGVLTLTNVSVVDPSTGLDIKGLTLAPGESKVVETSYVITQADLDNNGGGNGYLENTSVADSNETMPVTDTETVQLLAKPILFVNKSFVNVTGGNSNNLVDAVGDQLNYQILLANPGNVTLTNVSLVENLTGLTDEGLVLDPGDVKVYNVTYTLTQADLDNNGGGDGRLDNTSVADSDQTLAVTDQEGVTVIYDAQIDLTKYVSVDGGESWQDANALTGPLLSQASGIDPLFKYTALNNGTVTLKNLTLSDEAFDLNGGADGSDWLWGDLAPGDLAEYIFETPFALGQNSGDAVVMASTAFAPVLDIDNAYYLGV